MRSAARRIDKFPSKERFINDVRTGSSNISHQVASSSGVILRGTPKSVMLLPSASLLHLSGISALGVSKSGPTIQPLNPAANAATNAKIAFAFIFFILFIPQRLYRIQPRRLPCGIVPENHPHYRGNTNRQAYRIVRHRRMPAHLCRH